MYWSADATAHRLKISKTHLLACVRDGRVKPAPTKVSGKQNSPWLFAPEAAIMETKKPLDKRKVKAR